MLKQDSKRQRAAGDTVSLWSSNQRKTWSKSMEGQRRSYTGCYRGGQGWLNHHAYLRLCKVFFILRLLRHVGVSVRSGDIFDYGFGAGTFFRYCARNCRLFGVEVDSHAVKQVTCMLEGGRWWCDLRVIDPDAPTRHPLLRREYDLVVCSHVLEHLDAPFELISALGRCLKEQGVFIGIVPINELRRNPQHIQVLCRTVVENWTVRSGLRLLHYEEADTLSYPIQPLFIAESGWRHTLAQIVSLSFGLATTTMGQRLWNTASNALQKAGLAKAAQAGFVLAR